MKIFQQFLNIHTSKLTRIRFLRKFNQHNEFRILSYLEGT